MRFCNDEKLADEWKKKVEQGVCDFAWESTGDAIPNVKEYPYLGVTIDSELNWVAHFKKKSTTWQHTSVKLLSSAVKCAQS